MNWSFIVEARYFAMVDFPHPIQEEYGLLNPEGYVCSVTKGVSLTWFAVNPQATFSRMLCPLLKCLMLEDPSASPISPVGVGLGCGHGYIEPTVDFINLVFFHEKKERGGNQLCDRS
jgi:hypothetical protein